MSGWIRLHRDLIEKPIWTTAKAEQKVVLITILMLANHKEKEWIWQGERFKVAPGQIITSLSSLSKKAGVTIKSVRTALINFEKLEFLANQSAKTGRLITVVNWALYQSDDDASAKIPAKHRQSSGKAPATNNNDKNDKNEKNNIITAYSDNEKLRTAVWNFLDMRNSVKAQMTDNALELMLEKLTKLGSTDNERIAILEQSIMNSWKGVFEIKQDPQQPKKHRNIER